MRSALLVAGLVLLCQVCVAAAALRTRCEVLDGYLGDAERSGLLHLRDALHVQAWRGGAVPCCWLGVACKLASHLTTPSPLSTTHVRAITITTLANGTLPTSLFTSLSYLLSLRAVNVARLGGRLHLPDAFDRPTSPAVLSTLVLQNVGLSHVSTSALASLARLTSLELSHNALSGVFGAGSGGGANASLPRLHRLVLAGNRLDGIADSVVADATELAYVDVSSNALTALPASLVAAESERTALRVLLAPRNRLRVFPDVQRFPLLEQLDLSNNELDVSLPAELASLPNLAVLSLSGNPIWGAVPVAWVNLTVPNVLLQNTALTEVPCELLKARHIVTLDLSRNRLTSAFTCSPNEVPDALQSMLSMDLSHNALSGDVLELTNNIGKRQQLTSLHVGYNQLSGERFNFRVFPRLTDLALDHNLISGTFMEDTGSFGAWRHNVVTLDLSGNRLEGGLPEDPKQVSVLNLRENAFMSGCIPTSFVESGYLSRLSARSTKLRFCNEEQGVPVLQPDTEMRLLDQEFNLTCPRWLVASTQAVLDLSPAAFGLRECECAAGEYYDGSRCLPCPSEAIVCDRSVLNPQHRLVPGYYPTKHGKVVTDPTELLSASFEKCYQAVFCNPDKLAEFECGPHRKLDAYLCSQCEQGTYAIGSRCNTCLAGYRFVVPLSFAMLVIGALAFLYRKSKADESAALSIFFFWMQVLAILDEFGYAQDTSHATDTRGGSMLFGNQISLVRAITNFTPLAFECVQHRYVLDFDTQFYLVWLAPVWLGLLMAAWVWLVEPGVVLVRRRLGGCSVDSEEDEVDDAVELKSSSVLSLARDLQRDRQHFEEAANEPYDDEVNTAVKYSRRSQVRLSRWVFMFNYAMMLLIMPLCQRMFEVFQCVDPEDPDREPYLSAAPYRACVGSSYHRLVGLAAAGVVMYAVLLPIFWGAMLYRLHRNDAFFISPRAELAYGFLYRAFIPTKFLWNMVAVVPRKLAFVALLSLMPRDSPEMIVAVFSVLLAAVIAQVVSRPYRDRVDNWLETVLLSSALLTYLVGIVRAVDTETIPLDMHAMQDVVHTLNFVLLLVSLVLIAPTRVQRWLQRCLHRLLPKHERIPEDSIDHMTGSSSLVD